MGIGFQSPYTSHKTHWSFSELRVKMALTLNSYKIVLDSDAGEFGGHKRIDHNTEFVTFAEGWDNRMNHMFVSADLFTFMLRKLIIIISVVLIFRLLSVTSTSVSGVHVPILFASNIAQ